jgi:heterodisulfide reductase subunit B
MGIPYFPGCTLSTKAKNYDRSGRVVAEALGLPLEELPEWQCCGATFPLMLDDSMALIAPTRILYQAQEAGDRVTTLCSICFNVLRRSQALLGRDEEMLDRINWFTEQDYEGDVHVAHFLEILRDDVGWGEEPDPASGASDTEKASSTGGDHRTVAEHVRRPLTGLKVAPYYGCLLLRPYEEIGLDDPEDPHILHDLVRALGAEPVDFPYNVECCGSYLVVKEPEVPRSLAEDIVASAREHGADLIITACPLCQFNLDYPQRESEVRRAGERVPVLYFTQLMAVAFGLPEETWGFEDHYVDPSPIFV